MLTSKKKIEKVMGENGISNDTLVLAYDANRMGASRLLWSLFMYGHQNVKVIDGGFDAIQGAGIPMTTDVSAPEPNTILKVPQGVAKTTRCYLYFHEVELEDRMLVDRAHQFEMPALPVLAPEVYMEASVLDPYITDQYHHETERFLYRGPSL